MADPPEEAGARLWTPAQFCHPLAEEDWATSQSLRFPVSWASDGWCLPHRVIVRNETECEASETVSGAEQVLMMTPE